MAITERSVRTTSELAFPFVLERKLCEHSAVVLDSVKWLRAIPTKRQIQRVIPYFSKQMKNKQQQQQAKRDNNSADNNDEQAHCMIEVFNR